MFSGLRRSERLASKKSKVNEGTEQNVTDKSGEGLVKKSASEESDENSRSDAVVKHDGFELKPMDCGCEEQEDDVPSLSPISADGTLHLEMSNLTLEEIGEVEHSDEVKTKSVRKEPRDLFNCTMRAGQWAEFDIDEKQ